jgi:hypothetical protein
MPDDIRNPSNPYPTLPASGSATLTKPIKVIGICGFIGSGKDSVANYLIREHGFVRDSFARTLKDALSVIFGWDRTMLEGLTEESRAWRNQVDPWWAKRLEIPHLTPRWMMQEFGTNLMRCRFHDEIFIAAVENTLRRCTEDAVVPDVRFANEMRALRRQGAWIIRVKRGPEPHWFDVALTANTASDPAARAAARAQMEALGVHESEWSWIGEKIDLTIENNGSLEELFGAVMAALTWLSAMESPEGTPVALAA